MSVQYTRFGSWRYSRSTSYAERVGEFLHALLEAGPVIFRPHEGDFFRLILVSYAWAARLQYRLEEGTGQEDGMRYVSR
jgi:hypothetical protein